MLLAMKQLLSWQPHKGALAYSGTALGSSLMTPVFSFYYVKVFLDIYKIPESSFHTVQFLYMIWNALNDPLFGYCQDNSGWFVVRSRRHTILYGAPLFALSFLVPWFPWGDYSSERGQWLVGLHLLVALFFYDAMFTYVLLAAGCLAAEMSSSHEDRIRMQQYGAVAVLIGSVSVFVCEQVSHHLEHFSRFQCLTVILGILAFLAMNYTGRNAKTMYDKEHHKKGSTKKVSDRSTNHSIWKLTWQILSNPNFFSFVTFQFMNDFHSTFASNFCMIIVDNLIPKDTVPLFMWSLFYGLVMFLPRVSLHMIRRHLLEKLDDRIFWRFFFSTVGGGIKKNTIILTKARMEWKKNPLFIDWNTPFAATNSLWELKYYLTMLVSLLLWHCACTRHFKRLTVLCLVCAVDQKQDWLGGLE